MKITISKNHQGWTATFDGSADMPNGVALPLPFTREAPAGVVRADLRRRFNPAAIITKADSRCFRWDRDAVLSPDPSRIG